MVGYSKTMVIDGEVAGVSFEMADGGGEAVGEEGVTCCAACDT